MVSGMTGKLGRCMGLFTGKYNTQDYGTFTGLVYSFGRSTSCSSHIIFILAPTIFHCSIVHVGALFIVIQQTQNSYCNVNLEFKFSIPTKLCLTLSLSRLIALSLSSQLEA